MIKRKKMPSKKYLRLLKLYPGKDVARELGIGVNYLYDILNGHKPGGQALHDKMKKLAEKLK
jgi:hypothetical protein